MKKKSAAQLNREIAEALAKAPARSHFGRRGRGHHVSRATAADDWDVAMDAILEHDPSRASQIVRKLRDEHGAAVSESDAFTAALESVPLKVKNKFFELTDDEGGTEFRDAVINQMFSRWGRDDRWQAILGDEPLYTRRFRMPKWNTPVTALQEPDVAIRYHNELGVPTSKQAHAARADHFRDLKRRFETENRRLIREGEKAYGTNGPHVSGGFHEDWPLAVQSKLGFLAHGITRISEAIALHQKLSKTRSPAFR